MTTVNIKKNYPINETKQRWKPNLTYVCVISSVTSSIQAMFNIFFIATYNGPSCLHCHMMVTRYVLKKLIQLMLYISSACQLEQTWKIKEFFLRQTWGENHTFEMSNNDFSKKTQKTSVYVNNFKIDKTATNATSSESALIYTSFISRL